MHISARKKIWRYREQAEKSLRLNGIDLPPIAADILAQRGISDDRQIEDFFNPQLADLPSPWEMKGVPRASEMVAGALETGQPIIIYGDYDVDGVTSTAFLYLFLKELGGNISYYVPDRFSEGYGLDRKVLATIAAANRQQNGETGLLITVDCGISAVDEVEAARQEGFSVIITDHHRPPERLPEADVIINPLQDGCPSAAKELAGVGVAFYLAIGIRQHLRSTGMLQARSMREPNMKKFMDLVAIGTIADMASMTGVNRTLVTAGLQVLEEGIRVGIAALMREAECINQPVSAEVVAFKIAPRLNAAGRIGHAGLAVELLTADDAGHAARLAAQLEEMNQTRRDIEKQMFEKILPLAEDECANGRHVLVLWGEDFHSGVMGVVASRLAERFYRPAVLLSVENGSAKGSGRSVEGINLFHCIEACQKLLVRYGGHKAAAGMTVATENLVAFREAMDEAVVSQFDSKVMQPELWIDSMVNLEDLFRADFMAIYSRMEPFGIDNSEPLFATNVSTFHSLNIVGNDHLRFSIAVNGSLRSGIGFGLGSHLDSLKKGEKNILAFRLRRNYFRGRCEWEMHLVDVGE